MITEQQTRSPFRRRWRLLAAVAAVVIVCSYSFIRPVRRMLAHPRRTMVAIPSMAGDHAEHPDVPGLASIPVPAARSGDGRIPIADAKTLRAMARQGREFRSEFERELNWDRIRKKYPLAPEDLRKVATILAVARISQLVYEASIAEVKLATPNHVVVAIPEYDASSLLTYIRANISTVDTDLAGSPDLERIFGPAFGQFGKGTQKIDITKGAPSGPNDFAIKEAVEFPDLAGYSGNSLLREPELGEYSVLVATFMK